MEYDLAEIGYSGPRLGYGGDPRIISSGAVEVPPAKTLRRSSQYERVITQVIKWEVMCTWRVRGKDAYKVL